MPCLYRKSSSPGARSCEARASLSACRCWIRWFRRKPRSARRRRFLRAGSWVFGIRTAPRPDTGARYRNGSNFEFSFITKPLEPFRNRMTLISGMDMPEAMATTEEPGGDHARGAVLLSAIAAEAQRREPVSGRNPRPVGREEVRPGHDSRIDPAWASRKTATSATATGAIAAPTPTAISWTSPIQPLPTEVNPRVAFERLFGDGVSPEERRSGPQAERQHSGFDGTGDLVLQAASGRGR